MIFAVKGQANKITEGLRTFQKCLLEKKKDTQFLLLMKGHAVTLQILFLLGISWWWKVEKPFSSLIFWKHGVVNEFYGAIDISYQIRGTEFPVIRGMEKPKLLHTGTCTSTSTRHVTLKSPLLLQFPYCELCDNDNKQSNYRLMNVLFCTRALFANFSKSSK